MARSKCMLNDVLDRLGRALVGFSGRQGIVLAVQAGCLRLAGRECSTSRAGGVERALVPKLCASARRVSKNLTFRNVDILLSGAVARLRIPDAVQQTLTPRFDVDHLLRRVDR